MTRYTEQDLEIIVEEMEDWDMRISKHSEEYRTSEPFDPTKEGSKKKSVFIGQQPSGTTIIVGDESKEEYITTDSMGALNLAEYR